MEHLVKTALDAGFVNKCAEYGIDDADTVGHLMKLAADAATSEHHMQKQASYQNVNSHDVEMQKQANLSVANTTLDAGFINRCHEHGIVNPNEVHSLMKVAFKLLEEEAGMQKSAGLHQQDAANLHNVMSRL